MQLLDPSTKQPLASFDPSTGEVRERESHKLLFVFKNNSIEIQRRGIKTTIPGSMLARN